MVRIVQRREDLDQFAQGHLIMDETFTKGPWTVKDISDYDDAKLFYVESSMEIIAEMVGREANAVLIAAAPDLVEALREARETINRLIAWEGAVETCTPELGGLIAAMYHARAEIPRIDAALKKAGA